MIISAKDNIEIFLQNLSDGNFVSRKIISEYYTYKDTDISSFFVLNELSLMIMGENMSVSGVPNPDELEELISFCSFMGIYGLECENGNLPVKTKVIMNLMSFAGETLSDDAEFCKNTNIYGFSKFCRQNFQGVSFETVYSYFAKKVNKGLSDIYYIKKGGDIVSGLMASDYGTDIYLTFVSTDKKYRAKGHASRLIRCVAAQYDKNCILICENNLLNFYTNLGFEKKGEIYLYRLREKNI